MRLWHFLATATIVAIGCGDDGRARSNPFTTGLGTLGDGGIASAGDESDGSGGDDDDDEGDTGGSEGPDTDGGTAGAVDEPVPAAGITLTRVEANQGVAVALAEGGQSIPPASRTGTLLHGRTTLVQAEWSLAADGDPRTIVAELELVQADGTSEILPDEKVVDGASDLSSLSRSFAWVLAPEQVTQGARYRIRLFEADGVARDGSTQGAVFPVADAVALGLAPERMAMELVLIPVTTPEGGPNLDAATVATIEDRMRAAFPLQELEIRVRAPWVRSARLSSIDEAFNYLTSARTQDGEGTGPYYHLILDNSTCCTGDDFEGWAGIANLVDTSAQADLREGVTKLYPEYGDLVLDLDTLVHELGHNHGRDHAPCGDPGVTDPGFPYANASIGVRGYDIVEGTIFDPVAIDPEWGVPRSDFMSYCWPRWWSDYSWAALIERVKFVSALPAPVSPDGYRWRLRGFARGDAEPTWSWVRVPSEAAITAGEATLTVHEDDGTTRQLPVRVSTLADADVRILEADPPSALSIDFVELRTPDGRQQRTPGGSIVVAP